METLNFTTTTLEINDLTQLQMGGDFKIRTAALEGSETFHASILLRIFLLSKLEMR